MSDNRTIELHDNATYIENGSSQILVHLCI